MLQSYKVCPGLTAGSRVFFAIARLYAPTSATEFPQERKCRIEREGESTWMRAIPTRRLTVPVGVSITPPTVSTLPPCG
ncbi:hypothetical protein [uncultured Bacteroides sp.]|uniref:hypothetical protein n=1 Tax=uncultured Bacteroides sp. TaxID=162156 RepID=UPI0025AA276B|nr:hypothetical protein [uncultured Bacteroides sp.]